jgi:hypothetical protein
MQLFLLMLTNNTSQQVVCATGVSSVVRGIVGDIWYHVIMKVNARVVGDKSFTSL